MRNIARHGTKSARGFTLIELLVAMSLFAIAVAIAAGGFVRALRTQRQLIALISANSNASLAIEQMAREIRTGLDFNCSDVGPNGCDALTFTNSNGDQVTYSDDNGLLERSTGSGNMQPLTPADTEIQDLNFIILNKATYPPRITVTMAVTALSVGLSGNVTNLQTTVSSRNI